MHNQWFTSTEAKLFYFFANLFHYLSSKHPVRRKMLILLAVMPCQEARGWRLRNPTRAR